MLRSSHKIRSAVLTVLAALSITGAAEAEEAVKAVNIPAGQLTTALKTLAEQSGVEFFYSTDQLEGLKTQGVRGEYTAEKALQKLLEGTRLKLTRHESGALVITYSDTTATGRQGDITVGEREGAIPSQGRNELEEIIVTGSRLAQSGEPPAPVTTFDRKKIEELGAAGLPNILKYSTQQPFTRASSWPLHGEQFAQFRGLPVGSTAVLINGRRVAITANNISGNGVDLNMIPVAAIERVEILGDSGSAMYGADAVGGVMNIIIRRDMTRPTVDIRYGTAEGGAEERRVSLSTGYSGARFRASIMGDYFESDPLLGLERDRWSNEDYRRFGAADRRVEAANPGTVISTTGANLPGTSSRYARIRAGSSGVGLTPSDFISATTREDLRVEGLQRFEPIVLDQKRWGAAAFTEFDLTDALTAFVEGLYSDSTVIRPTNPTTATLRVPAGNPFNPFGVAVDVPYLFEGVGPDRTTLREDLYSATLGLKGRLHSWDWEISGSHSRSTSDLLQNENVVDTTQAGCLLSNPATRAAGACRGINEALNVFQDGPGGSAALLASLIAPPIVFAGRTESAQFTGFLRGAAFAVPAGSVDVVFGGSYDSEEVLSGRQSPAPTTRTAGNRNSKAAFAEMRIPLASPDMQIPALGRLTLNLAVRADRYSDFGDTVNPKYGLVWSPLAGLSFTASYGTSFSPPSLFRLFRDRTTRPNTRVVDPLRNETVFIDSTQGGNRNLDPEEGNSFIAGLVVSPQGLPGLRVSTHYWSVVLEDRISGLLLNQILANETLFPGRVVRAEPDGPGQPGRLVSVDSSPVNFARLETSGVDANVSFTFDTSWGEFSPALAATWTRRYEPTDFPDIPAQNRVGLASSNGLGTIPEWNLVGTLAWSRAGLGLSTTARFTDGYADTVTDAASNYVPTGRRIPSQTIVDLQGSVDMDKLVGSGSVLTEGLKVSVGVLNVFDKAPPYFDPLHIGFDPSQGDLLGRFVYLNASKAF